MQNTVTAHIGKTKYKTIIKTGNHTLIADEPEEAGGHDDGPTAGDYLRTALATCTAITLRMYADRKAWDLEEAEVTVDYEKTPTGTIFHRNILLAGDLDEGQKKRLLQIANACPVHKILTSSIEIQTLVK